MIEAHGTGESSASLPSPIYPQKSLSPSADLMICLDNLSRSMKRKTKMDMSTKEAMTAGATNHNITLSANKCRLGGSTPQKRCNNIN